MRDEEKFFGKAFLAAWGALLFINFAIWAVVIWAIIKLVNHYT